MQYYHKLSIYKNTISAKHNRVKHNKMRFICKTVKEVNIFIYIRHNHLNGKVYKFYVNSY